MNQVVLITGSTEGIGFATAVEFLNNLDKVVVFSRNPNNIDAAVTKLKKIAPTENIYVTSGDVTKAEDAKRIIHETLARFGKIDILINNAGVGVKKPLEETTDEEIDAIIDTNLKGTIYFIKEVLPEMKLRNKGIILNISSGLGISAMADYGVYTASKFGVVGITESLALELLGTKIKVQVVLPGAVNTSLYRRLNPRNKQNLMSPEFVAKKIIEITENLNKVAEKPKELRIKLFY